MYDLHVHSEFSMDCKYSMDDIIMAAINKNLKAITFTDHIELEVTDKKLDIIFPIDDYFKRYRQVKSKYEKDIEILCGLEIGMQPHLNKRYDELINSYPFDFIIMSIHTVKGRDLFEDSYYNDREPLDIFIEYYADIYKSLEHFNNFDVLGHLDLIQRHYKYSIDLKMEKYEYLIEKILRRLIEMGKGIELNTSGIRYGLPYYHPNIEILKLYKKLGGEIITIGSDAHKPEDIGYEYKEAEKLLRDIGYKYIFLFRNRKKFSITI